MSYLIVGASSGLGREIAYKFAEKGHNLIICSRDIKDLEAIKSDIEYKNKNKVTIEEIDISDKKNLETFLNKEELFKDLNGVLLPVGLMFDKDNVDLSFEESEKIFKSNFSCLTYIISKLRKLQVGTRPFFYPMHKQPVFKKMEIFNKSYFPVSEKLYEQGLYLPSSLTLKEEDIKIVSQKLKKII